MLAFLGLLWTLLLIYLIIAFGIPMVAVLLSIVINMLRDFSWGKLISLPKNMWDVALEELTDSFSRKS